MIGKRFMSKIEFLQECTCSYKFKKMLWLIEYHPMTKVMELYNLHQLVRKNVRYHQLEKAFNERFQKNEQKQQ
jgi:hypothetical protein